MSRLFRALAFALVAALALAAAPDPAAPVLAFDKDLRAAPAKDANAFRKTARAAIQRQFDLEAVTRTVLAERYDAASVAQRARLSDLIVRRLAERLVRERTGPPPSLRVLRSRDPGQGDWLVTTELRRGQDNPVTVTWKVRTAPKARIVDVLREGISLDVRARKELAAALKGRTLDQALTEMERHAPAD